MKLLSFIFVTFLLYGCNKTPYAYDWDGKWNFKSYKANNIQELYKHFKIKKGGEIDLYMFPLVGADYLFLNEGKAFYLSGTDYQYGNYKIQEDYILVNNEKAFEIVEGNPDQLVLKPLQLIFNQDVSTENDVIITYKKDHKYNITDLDYTDPKYNTWRIKTDKEEKYQQIIDRLKHQIEYAKVYFQKETDLHQEVKTIGVELPFLFYRNGIIIEKFHPSQKWLQYYSNFEDQKFVYNYLIHSFKQATYENIETDNILEYNLIIFDRMFNYLRTVKVSNPSTGI